MRGRDVRLKNIKGGKGKYYTYFEDYLQELKEKSANEKIFYNRIFILGQIDGIECGRDNEHKLVIEELIKTKNEIREMQEDDEELFHYEINYRKGYIKALEKVLETNRYYFEINTPIFICTLFDDQELLNKCKSILVKSKFLESSLEYDEIIEENTFYFTTSLNEFIKKITKINEDYFDIAINLVRNKNNETDEFNYVNFFNKIPIDEMHRINAIQYKDTMKINKILNKMIENVCFIK